MPPTDAKIPYPLNQECKHVEQRFTKMRKNSETTTQKDSDATPSLGFKLVWGRCAAEQAMVCKAEHTTSDKAEPQKVALSSIKQQGHLAWAEQNVTWRQYAPA